jgi:hypothetical protein
MPGLEYPGAQKFEKDWQVMYSSVPETNHAIYYNCLWTVIEAMKLVGTAEDTEAIGRAARSGMLEWDTPMGRAHFTPEGGSGLRNIVVEVREGGEIVRITW